MKTKKITKPMHTLKQNYWKTGNPHIVPRWLDKNIKVIDPRPMGMSLRREMHDTDGDGVPNFRDCNIWNPNEQGAIHEAWNKVKSRVTGKEYSSDKDSGVAEDVKTVGKDIIGGAKSISKKGIERVKGIYSEAKQFNPETRNDPSVVGKYKILVMQPVVDEYGRVVDQQWVDMGSSFDKSTAEQVAYQLTQRGYVYKVIPPKTTLTEGWKENVKGGLHIKQQRRIPMINVAVHPGSGMMSKQVQQEGYSSRSSAGYSPMFVGATKKQFRVGGDR